jgi:serine/threonine protein kinase
VVFAAWDLDLDSEVAIKVLPRFKVKNELWAEALARLKNEILLNRKLKHPAIARTFDYGDAAGMPYITMELIHGKDLRAILEGSPLPVQQALGILRQVASACGMAHAAGITHRDLKPENLIVQPDGRAVVLDFGLGRFVDKERLTPEGGVVGTPYYLSPERLTGEIADARADVYALGILFFEMLVGSPPFTGDSVGEIARLHVYVRPDLKPLRDMGLPVSLIDLIEACLEKDPDKRPADGSEVLQRLDLPEAVEAVEVHERARCVLVVDDDPLIRRILTNLAQKCGAEVLQASNGEDALSILSTREANLVLLDLSMPVLDGFDTLAVIRSMPQYSRTPVVIVSSHDDRQNQAFSKSIGANGFLEKPLDLPKVRRVVEQWLA